jgi:hypothetical protein
MTETPYHWVTIARFWSPTQALFFKSVLEGSDIPVFVRNEYLGGLFAHMTFTSAEGGVELQVPSDCVDEALNLLDVLNSNNDDEESCPEDPKIEE